MKIFILITITFFTINSFAAKVSLYQYDLEKKIFGIYAEIGSPSEKESQSEAENFYNSLLFEPSEEHYGNDREQNKIKKLSKFFQTKDEFVQIVCTKTTFISKSKKPNNYSCSIGINNSINNADNYTVVYKKPDEDFVRAVFTHQYGENANDDAEYLYKNLDFTIEKERSSNSKTLKTNDDKVIIICNQDSLQADSYGCNIAINISN